MERDLNSLTNKKFTAFNKKNYVNGTVWLCGRRILPNYTNLKIVCQIIQI